MFQNQGNPYGFGMAQISPGINWVESVQQAEQVELPPGCDIALLNKNKDELYIRSRDRYNIYSTRIFELKEVTPVKQESQYVTRTELEEMFQRFLGGMNNVAVSGNECTETVATGTEPLSNQSASSPERKESNAKR